MTAPNKTGTNTLSRISTEMQPKPKMTDEELRLQCVTLARAGARPARGAGVDGAGHHGLRQIRFMIPRTQRNYVRLQTPCTHCHHTEWDHYCIHYSGSDSACDSGGCRCASFQATQSPT